MLRKRNECQEEPIRLTYLVSETKPTWKQYESEMLSRGFKDYYGKMRWVFKMPQI